MAKQLAFEMQVSPLTPTAPAPETPAAVYHTAAGIRERLERYGVQSLIEAELVSALTGTSLEIAQRVIDAFEGNLIAMAGASSAQLEKIKGISKTKAAQIVAAFEIAKRLAVFHAERPKITSPSDVADLMMSKMRYLQKEIVCVLCLDTKGGVTNKGLIGEGDLPTLAWGRVISTGTVFTGTLNASVFHPREIFRFAIEHSANSIVLVHNHPSGDPQPSAEDIRATKQLVEAGENIGIKVLDHIIIGDGIFCSLKEEGRI